MASFDEHAQSVLYEAVKIVFPLNVDPVDLIKRHVWRNRKYVGETNAKVVFWQGWSANLNQIDFRYRAVFVDVVDNSLSQLERVRLFGSDFVSVVDKWRRFVVLFVLDFPLDTTALIKAEGFTPRIMERVAHACILSEADEFVSKPISYWAARLARLILLQRVLSTHRKSFDSNEVPLQNLLYRTGYLHSYIVNGGLELKSLSRPRKAGDFGHDLHAIVRNPSFATSDLLSLGIEVYMGSIGYHLASIPAYVTRFNLSGMIVIAKDDPLNELKTVEFDFPKPIRQTKLNSIGDNGYVGIHYLPFERVITDLDRFRDELDEIVPSLPTYFK